MAKWIISGYQHSWVNEHLLVLVETDQPIHAFLHYSLSPEIYSLLAGERRGVRRVVTPLWELSDQVQVEQAEPGDTTEHQFFLPAVPYHATLTFFIAATQGGIEAKSVSIPIKLQHPHQDGADPVNPTAFGEYINFAPWRSNFKDAVGIHDDIWNVTGMTGTGYFAYGMNQLSLIIGPTPGSVAEIYAGDIFALAFDNSLRSQLRAVVRFPIVDNDLLASMIHGTIASNSGYGFQVFQGNILGFVRAGADILRIGIATPCIADTTYLLEAKWDGTFKVEFWVDGEYKSWTSFPNPPTSGHSFHARVENPTTGSSAIHFRRFMIWQESIWTGEYHG